MNSKTKNCPGDEVLLQYVENRLAPKEYDELALHLHRCEECLQMVAVLLQANKNKTVESLHEEKEEEPKKKTFSADDYDEVIGARVGRYVIVEHIGSGGMGDVFKAYDPELDRKIALKLVHSELMDDSGSSAKARLMREAQAMAKLSHPNVVAVHDVQTVDDDVAIAMEFIDGVTLKEWLKEKKRNWSELADVFVQAGEGLQAAHEKGLIHRDFKPENVLIRKDGRVFVSDFGLVARRGDGQKSLESGFIRKQRSRNKKLLDTELTRSGALLGTPFYMSPEQYGGEFSVDSKTDQFSFCIVLFESLYGKRPFEGRSLEELKQKTISADSVILPRERHVPSWLRSVLLRGLSKDPSDRFDSMKEIVSVLKDCSSTNRRRLIYTVSATLLVVLGIILLLQFYKKQDYQCSKFKHELSDLWNPTKQKEVKNSFLNSKVDGAENNYKAVLRKLSNYSEKWANSLVEACRDTHERRLYSPEVLDLRVACLQDLKASFSILVHNLTGSIDQSTVRKAINAIDNISTINKCSNISQLKALDRMNTEPDSPNSKEMLTTLRNNIREIKIMYDLGNLTDGKSLTERVIRLSSKHLHPWIITDAYHWRAMFLEVEGKYAEAIEALVESARLAGITGNMRYFLNAIRVQAWIMSVRNKKHSDALALLEYVDERVIGSPLVSSLDWKKIQVTKAIIQTEIGNFSEAAKNLRNAVKAFEAEYGVNNFNTAKLYHNLGYVLSKQGLYEESLTYFKKAKDATAKSQSEDHFFVGNEIVAIGSIYRQMGNFDTAVAMLKEGYKILCNSIGREHKVTIKALLEMCKTKLAIHSSDAARKCFKEVVDTEIKTSRSRSKYHLEAVIGLASCYFSKKDYQQSKKYIIEAFALSTEGPENFSLNAKAKFLLAKIQSRTRKNPSKYCSYAEQALKYHLSNEHNFESIVERKAIAGWMQLNDCQQPKRNMSEKTEQL